MLINCVECALQVSDKAIVCPHCGYPLKEKAARKTYTSKNKRRRLPNGFGQISEIKGKNLKKPYRAMVSVGMKANGRPLVKPLKPESYFKTYNEAYEALIEYHKNPYDFIEDITLDELFNRWFEEYKTEGLSHQTYYITERAWLFCSTVYTLPVKDVKIRHIRQCVEQSSIVDNGVVIEPNPRIRVRIKELFNKLLDYAVSNELLPSNPARQISTPKQYTKAINDKKHHVAFTADEIQSVWDKKPELARNIMLVQFYSGWRPGEVMQLRTEDVDLKAKTMVGGLKTDAGRDRVVPIHPAIENIIKSQLKKAKSTGSETLFFEMEDGAPRAVKPNTLRKTYAKLEHTPHDGRKTFITLAKKYNVDEYAIKYIVGHKIMDLTEDVYTDREISWLYEQICKIKGPETRKGT